MSTPGTYPAGRADLHADVVGVELTIDGMLVVADRLDLTEFTALGIRANIADEDVRTLVWDQVRRDLIGQGVLDSQGYPDPAVAQMIDTLGRAERTLECRWFRRADATMIRFVLCRRGEFQVIAVRDGDLVQRVSHATRTAQYSALKEVHSHEVRSPEVH